MKNILLLAALMTSSSLLIAAPMGDLNQGNQARSLAEIQFDDSVGAVGPFMSPDVCNNIPGYQASAPENYEVQGGDCVPTPPAAQAPAATFVPVALGDVAGKYFYLFRHFARNGVETDLIVRMMANGSGGISAYFDQIAYPRSLRIVLWTIPYSCSEDENYIYCSAPTLTADYTNSFAINKSSSEVIASFPRISGSFSKSVRLCNGRNAQGTQPVSKVLSNSQLGSNVFQHTTNDTSTYYMMPDCIF